MFPFDDNIPSIPSIPTLYTDSGRRPANGPMPGYRRRNMLLRMIRSALHFRSRCRRWCSTSRWAELKRAAYSFSGVQVRNSGGGAAHGSKALIGMCEICCSNFIALALVFYFIIFVSAIRFLCPANKIYCFSCTAVEEALLPVLMPLVSSN